jgi:hypothetical protein
LARALLGLPEQEKLNAELPHKAEWYVDRALWLACAENKWEWQALCNQMKRFLGAVVSKKGPGRNRLCPEAVDQAILMRDAGTPWRNIHTFCKANFKDEAVPKNQDTFEAMVRRAMKNAEGE